MEYVLLTGATSSIGKAIAVSLSDKYAIILAGRNLEEIELVKAQLKGKDHLIWQCDFVKENIKPIRLQKAEDTLKSFQINVFSAIDIMSVLSKKEFRTNLNNVLFFSSISSIRGNAGYSVYASAKSALLGLMRSLAIELKPIKINAIILGAVKTKATEFIINEKEEYLNTHIPLGLAQDDVLNNWMLFLLEGKTWMTGQEIIIDGGATVL